MKLELTKEQEKEIALHWIKQQQNVIDGYKPIMDILFTGGHFGKWSWLNALQYAIKVAGRSYCTGTQWIIDKLNRA